MDNHCASCGMTTEAGLTSYHPYAACLMYQCSRNGSTVAANLRAVVLYGMDCQRLGISLDRAMRDVVVRRKKATR